MGYVELAAKMGCLWYILRMARNLLLVFVFGLVAGSTRAAGVCGMADERVRIMLRDFEVTPALREQNFGFLQVLADEAAKVPGFEVLSTDEVREALDQEAEKALLGCSENDCLAEIAEAMNVSLIVSGSVLQDPEGGVLVSLFLLNTRAVVVVNRVVMRWRGASDQLLEVVRAAAQTLLLPPEQRPPGVLQLVGLPKGARVFIDGAENTTGGQGGRYNDINVGPHEVLVEAEGMIPTRQYVVIRTGELSTVNVWLEPAPPTLSWLLAGTGGALLAGGAMALAVAYFTGQSDVTVNASLTPYGLNDFVAQQKTTGTR